MRRVMVVLWYVMAGFAFAGIVHKDWPFAACCMVAMILCDLHTPRRKPEPAPTEIDELAEFERWWETHGQFVRAGGGDYEKSFAFAAWRHLRTGGGT
jgi:hypothetical protein